MFEGNQVPSLSKDYRRTRGGQTLPRTPRSPLRITETNHFRQRPTLRQSIRHNPMQGARHTTKPIHRLPSQNRRTDRTDECLAGTIPSTVVCITPQGMGTAPPNCGIRPQLLEARHAETDPSRTHHRHNAVCQYQPYPRPCPSRTRATPDPAENTSGTAGKARSSPEGKRKQKPAPADRGAEGLARRT
jgi:hypothetical protein